LRSFLLVLFCAASVSSPAKAQEVAPAASPDAHEVEGVVRDSDGLPVPEARLVLHADAGEVESTDTDQQGRFRLPEVPSGVYSLDVEAPGFLPLRHALTISGDVRDLALKLEPVGGGAYRTLVQEQMAPLPAQDATTSSTVLRRDIEALPGGTSLSLNDVVATQQGITRDAFGSIHVRGNFAGLQLRIDGVQLPPAIQNRLQQLIEPQIVAEARVIVGGLPAEYGQNVAGVIDVLTRRPEGPFHGDAQLLYGTYQNVQGQANVAGTVGPVHLLVAGSLETTNRGLDPPAASPILHDSLQQGNVFLRADTDLSVHDRLELLGVYAQSHYQIPIDPTLLPLSQGPANAVRGTDRYGNSAPTFVPYDSNPTQLEQELFVALSWFHDFAPGAKLQVTPFFRSERSDLACDTANQLGPTADPGQTCSSVNNQVTQGGLQINQTLGLGPNEFKAGLLLDAQQSKISYSQYARNDADPSGAPSLAVSGTDDLQVWFGGIYLQDRVSLGKLTLLPGLRLDVQHASLQGTNASTTLWGPSIRLGAAYAFTERVVLHAFAGILWQPPAYGAPTAARALGLVPPGEPLTLDQKGETNYYAEIGIAARVVRQLTLSLTTWGRLSRYTLDDAEVGDTALTADYNYERGRAAGIELQAQLVAGKNLRGFANLTAQIAQGSGIASSQYLFTPEQLAYAGWQTVDNVQALTANFGLDLADNPGDTHLEVLVTCGSGLRTGPTNSASLPASAIVNATLRHRFSDVPLKPELAFDVFNLFDVIYAYRIATGGLAGSAYGSLRTFNVRLIVPFGS